MPSDLAQAASPRRVKRVRWHSFALVRPDGEPFWQLVARGGHRRKVRIALEDRLTELSKLGKGRVLLIEALADISDEALLAQVEHEFPAEGPRHVV